MKRYTFPSVAVVLLMLMLVPTISAAPLVPKLVGVVNDYADVLTSEEEKALSEILLVEEASSSNQLVVLTVKSLEGETVEDYAMQVAKDWKLGQADKDNGILLIVSTNDRKIRIEVGYGLEAVIPDGIAGQIIRDHIGPALKDDKYYDGLLAGVTQIHLAIAGEFEATSNVGELLKTWPAWVVVIVAIVLCLIVGPELWIVGGLIGVIAGFLAPWSIADPGPIFVLWVILGGIIGMAVSFLGRDVLEGLAESGDGYSGGSSWSSSGSSSSGSSYSGGGGDFGGGGSSGDY